MGLIATMSALVLSLLIASANSSYDRQSSELKALATNVLLLDRTLKFYGPGAKEARNGLREAIVQTHDRIWSREGVRPGLRRAAVEFAIGGKNAVMPAIRRFSDEPYRLGIIAAPLAEVANQEKLLPPDFISADGLGTTRSGPPLSGPANRWRSLSAI